MQPPLGSVPVGTPRTPSVPAPSRGKSRAGLGGPPPAAGSGQRRTAPPSAEPGGRRRCRRGELAVPPVSEDVALQVRLASSHLQPRQHGPFAGEDPPARYGGAGVGDGVSPLRAQRPGGARTGRLLLGVLGAGAPETSGAFFSFFYFAPFFF